MRDILADYSWKQDHHFGQLLASMSRMMLRSIRLLTAVALVSGCLVGLVGCGGDGPSGDVVAQVGKTAIDRATLNEWMESVAGGDYFEHVHKVAPRGLVSDPPNYARCISTADKIVPKSASGQPEMTRTQLAGKCRQLYRALKEQALSLLISIDSRIGEGAERGLDASEAEVSRLFARIKAEEFPKESEYQAYLAQRDWTPSVEIFQLKRNIITSKIEPKFQGAGTGWQRAYALSLVAGIKKWSMKTTCRPGYVVSGCKEYKPSATSPTAPALLLEELAGTT